MKTALALIAAITLTLGCSVEIGGRSKFKLSPVTPPEDAIVSATARSIGIQVGQSVNQTPELNLGFKSVTYNRVPTGSNAVAPDVRAGIVLSQQGFSTGITDDFATGVPANRQPDGKAAGVVEALKSSGTLAK